MDTHFDALTDSEIEDIRDRHLRAEHRADEESEFAASNAHHDRGFLLSEIDRLRSELEAATGRPRDAAVRPGLLGSRPRARRVA